MATTFPSESTNLSIDALMRNLEHTVQVLQDTLLKKEYRIKTLEYEMIQKTSDISELRESIRDLKMSIQQPNMANSTTKNIFQKVTNERSKLQEKNDGKDNKDGDKEKTQMHPPLGIKENANIQWNISRSILSLENRKRQPGIQHVAFHAYQRDSRSYSFHEILQYEIEEVNVGGGFNHFDSIFSVPVTGVYIFTWTIVPNLSSYVQAELIINGVVKGNAYAESNEIHNVHPTTGIVVAQANKGDHVFVRRGEHSASIVKSDDIYQRTTFSGWLLV
ncbi:hypothetical protein CHS0354_007457 [Potamilus streckersoni]|uniref:C1q domain-containing protein n=1 Tax=Potamilus streckersoni TaxID=2493646 RepID=A0AAE0SVR0_9BIVA|nr:hypothetical protein CHS0354_007457 [Potamilus streckersoni]